MLIIQTLQHAHLTYKQVPSSNTDNKCS